MSIFGRSTNFSRGAGDKTQRLVWKSGLALTVGMLIVSFLMALSGPTNQGPQIGVGLTSFLVYTASLTVGAFLGFLFGLPRARLIDQVTSPQPGTITDTEKPTLSASHFLANSNLIKVSDWLTTIIIGLTLVNLGEILPAVRELSNALDEPLGGYSYSAAMGIAVAIGSVLAGFILGYLWTSIRVRELLEEAEQHATRPHLADLTNLTVDQAKEFAAFLGLNLVVPFGAARNATIIDQHPKPGTRIAPSEEIKVSV